MNIPDLPPSTRKPTTLIPTTTTPARFITARQIMNKAAEWATYTRVFNGSDSQSVANERDSYNELYSMVKELCEQARVGRSVMDTVAQIGPTRLG